MSILLEYPQWFLLLVAILAAIYALVLYRADKVNEHISKTGRFLLGLLRFLSVGLIAFFLLGPLIKSVDREIEKPIVVIAQDNSESIIVNGDSSFYKGTYLNELQGLKTQLSEKYDVFEYSFGDVVTEGLDSISFDQATTDYSNLMEELYSKFSNRNLGALVIATDGIYNKGSNPLYSYKKMKVPVYTVAMGDTTLKKDALIAEVNHNKLAYLGNRFPLEVYVRGSGYKGQSVQLSVTRKGNSLYSKRVNFEEDFSNIVVPITLEAKAVGLQRFRVQISTLDGEVTTENNYQDIYIDVLDSRQKILIISSSPHPDVMAMNQSISSNKNYEVETTLYQDFNGKVGDYSMILFHQMPTSNLAQKSLMAKAKEQKIPFLVVFGAKTNFGMIEDLSLGFSLDNATGNFNPVGGSFKEGFNLFELEDDTRKMFSKLPPLHVPFGDLLFSPGTSVLVEQQIGNIETGLPLIAFNKTNGNKVGLLAGEGIWRWRMVQFLNDGSHQKFDQFFGKIIQYLANKDDKSQFRVTGPTDIKDDENIIFEAEVYNDSYEPVTGGEVNVIVENEFGDQYNYALSVNGNRYKVDAGNLPAGKYSWTGKTTLGGKPLVDKGEFSIVNIQVELLRTRADHQFLYLFAKENGGDMVLPNELNQLTQLIESNKNVVNKSYEKKKLSDLINLKWILFAILGLLSIEWLIRKWSGSY